jgi:hypothetical protein
MLFIGYCYLVFTLLDGRTPGTAALTGYNGHLLKFTFAAPQPTPWIQRFLYAGDIGRDVFIGDDHVGPERFLVAIARTVEVCDQDRDPLASGGRLTMSAPKHLKVVEARSCTLSQRTPSPAAQVASGPELTFSVHLNPPPPETRVLLGTMLDAVEHQTSRRL